MARRRRKKASMFSFAFLDILATVVGVLIFLLLMGVLSQSGAVEASQWQRKYDELDDELAEAQARAADARKRYQDARAAAEDARRELSGEAARVAGQAAAVQEENDGIEQEIRAARDRVGGLEGKITALEHKKDQLEKERDRLAQPGRPHMLPRAEGGARATPIHVDCRESELIIMGADVGDSSVKRIHVPADRIEDAGGSYSKLLDGITKRNARRNPTVLVLWVRPDGIKTADTAINVAKERDVPLGWEPADSDWEF